MSRFVRVSFTYDTGTVSPSTTTYIYHSLYIPQSLDYFLNNPTEMARHLSFDFIDQSRQPDHVGRRLDVGVDLARSTREFSSE